MNDLDIFLAMLRRAGIGYEVDTEPTSIIPHELDGMTCVRMTEGKAHVDGYGGFYAELVFDRAGKLVQVGAWE